MKEKKGSKILIQSQIFDTFYNMFKMFLNMINNEEAYEVLS